MANRELNVQHAKNQGYHFEHNYGHGKQHLSTVLMLLAILVDQVQQPYCLLFQAALKKVKTRRSLWSQLRGFVRSFVFLSYRSVLKAILTDRCQNHWLPP